MTTWDAMMEAKATVRSILAGVRAAASREGAHYAAGCGSYDLPDGSEVEVAMVPASDGGVLLGTLRRYRRVGGVWGDGGRWRSV